MHPIALLLASFLAAPGGAQNVAVLVNGEPITSYDITQRTFWENRTNNFGERMKAFLSTALLSSNEFDKKGPLKPWTYPAQPRSQAEAQQADERIQKDLIECAKRKVLSEGGATRQAVIEALIDDRLKLQEARRLGIEINDEEVEASLVQRVAASAGAGADGEK